MNQIKPKRISSFFILFFYTRKKNLFFLLSFVLVAFGQEAWFGALGALAYLFGFAFFWKFLHDYQSYKTQFFLSWFWYSCVQLIHLSWLSALTYQGVYILVVYGLLCLMIGLQFSALSLFVMMKKPLLLTSILTAASGWVLLEYSRLFWLNGFTWDAVGTIMTHHIYPLQIASIIGLYGLSFWVIIVNLLAYKALFVTKTLSSRITWIGCALLPYCFGWINIYWHEKDFSLSQPLSALLVQTALLPEEKDFRKDQAQKFISPYLQWQKMFSYIKEKETTDLQIVVFPESALPFGAFYTCYHYPYIKQLWDKNFEKDQWKSFPLNNSEGKITQVSNAFIAQAMANYYQTDIIIGLDDVNIYDQEAYNAAFYFKPNQTKPERYIKQILVPMGEYLPFSWCDKLLKHFGITGFFTPGKTSTIFRGNHDYGISICAEETYSNIMRQSRLNGAKVFINLTNDVWFPYSKLPKQHFTQGRIRAVENGVPLLRSCNMGRTGAVDAFGRVIKIFENRKEKYAEKIQGALSVRFSSYNYHTLYLMLGDSLIIIISIFFIALSTLTYFFDKKCQTSFSCWDR